MSAVRSRISLSIVLIFGFVGLGLSPALAVDERVIDIVSVNWTGSAPLDASVDQIAQTVNTQVNTSWRAFTTLVGDTQDHTISFVTGRTLAAAITLNSKMACVGSASTDFMNLIRIEAYKRLAVTDYSKRYLIIAAPKAGCVWSGRAQIGGAQSRSGILVLHDTGDAYVIVHELGHTFGLGHTNFLRCDDNKSDGPWGDICKAVEYGGIIDVMGNVETTSPLNTYHQWRMGLLDSSQVKQVWQSQTLTLAPSDFATGIRAIYIRDGKSAYWIEYRRALDGVGYKPGLVIFRIDPPPLSSVVSPNPEDSTGAEFGNSLGTDVWMLNLDTYRYTNSNVNGGSMTGLSATTYSGNVSFSAVASPTGAVVTIKKKIDTLPPPAPILTPSTEWRYPGVEITKTNNEDADTAIASFQASIDGVISDLPVSATDNWSPTYLNPFTPPKTVHVRDLPEGTYSFALRAIDLAGNKSAWSAAVKVSIDRGRPVATDNFAVSAIDGDQISIAWNGAKDAGVGLCATNLVDEQGFVIQSSTAKVSPSFKFTYNVDLKATAQLFDCNGNGVSGDLSLTNTFMPADKSGRTGKWSPAGAPYGLGALKCVSKCTASFLTQGSFDLLMGNGAATVSTGLERLATIADSKSAKLRIATTIPASVGKRVIRVTGSNFVLIGLDSLSASITNIKDLDRLPAIIDPSLTDSKQIALAKFGFNASDFSQEWSLLPMSNGTTLLDPSLDLCGASFASEKSRVERRQVAAVKAGSPYSFLSTETVRYSSAAAAQSAQKELVKVLAQCEVDKGYKDTTGAVVPYSFSQIKKLPDGLVSDGSRVLVRAQIDTGARARALLGFYQFNGDVFTGLYVMLPSESGFTDAQVASWLKTAVVMAQRLSSTTR